MKILQIGMGNVAGGLEAFVMNYYRVLVHMDIQFDFVCMYDKIAYEEEIQKLGGRIYYIPNVKKNYQGYIKELKKILKETKYDAVHVNMLSAANIVPLRVAHTMKVPKIIAHSHSSSCPGTGTDQRLQNMLLTGLHAEKWRAGGCLEIKLSKAVRLR